MLINKSKNHYFYLHKWCILTKGHVRSTITDFSRERIKLIPNDLYDLIIKYNGNKVSKLLTDASNDEDRTVISEYFNFLYNEEFIVLLENEEKEFNIEINMEFDFPQIVNNGIIDYDNNSTYSIRNAIRQLNQLGCQSLHIRLYDTINIIWLDETLTSIKNTTIRDVSLFVKYVDDNFVNEIKNLIIEKFMRISQVIIHHYPINKEKETIENKHFIYSSVPIDSCNYCGVINPIFFDINKITYLTGQNHNTCLYKKITIDVEGDIKNCPSMKKAFGNIKKTSLSEALMTEEFSKLWNIKKADINICKDCEFRLVCTDCRAYVGNDIYAKPKKCDYDPYTATWKNS